MLAGALDGLAPTRAGGGPAGVLVLTGHRAGALGCPCGGTGPGGLSDSASPSWPEVIEQTKGRTIAVRPSNHFAIMPSK